MLLVLASLLCASCGSSGAPTDPASSGALATAGVFTATTDSDFIVGSGHSGFNLSNAQQSSNQPVAASGQAPSLGAAIGTIEASVVDGQQSPVIAEPSAQVTVSEIHEVDIGGETTVESEVAALQVELQVVDPAPEAEVNAVDLVTVEPEAEAELAALQSELQALEPLPENVAVSGNTIDTVSYQSIKDNGLDNGVYPTDDYYLAEFLFQNPDVCFWEQDKANKTITAVDVPVAPDDSIYLPTPTGGDDSSMLQAFINQHEGRSLVGQGTYKVKTVNIKVSVDIFDMPMEPVTGASEMVRITSPDVRIFSSPIDGKNSNTLVTGFHVEDGSDRFVLVKSGFKNIFHTKNGNASGVFIRGAKDFYVVCNRFENIINDTNSKEFTARANSIWLNGRNTETLSGGLIANNYAENHQSNGTLLDAEFFTAQGYANTVPAKPVRIFANRVFNPGKRFTKHQEGDALVLSNYHEWNTLIGPLGPRTLLASNTIHFGSNVIIRNNRVKVSAESDFGYIFTTDSKSGSIIQDNIHFDNNDIEIMDMRNPNSTTGPTIIAARATQHPIQSVGFEATNSTANNNKVYGTGNVQNYYNFRNGYEDTGGGFEAKNNDISIPFYKSEFQPFH